MTIFETFKLAWIIKPSAQESAQKFGTVVFQCCLNLDKTVANYFHSLMLYAKSVCCGQKFILKNKAKCGLSFNKVKKYQDHCCANSNMNVLL